MSEALSAKLAQVFFIFAIAAGVSYTLVTAYKYMP
jgi:hypothetical protein